MCFAVLMADLLALIAISVTVVLGVGAIVVSIYLDKKRNPRREFTYSVEAAPLVNSGAKRLDKLTVSYDGNPVSKPYLVTVELGSTGRADISSASFDGGKPVRIDLQVPVLAEIDQRASVDTVDARLFIAGGTVVELPPSLLPKGYTLRASYICDGRPDPQVKVELADIPIRMGILNRPTATWPNLLQGALQGAILIAMTVVITLWTSQLIISK